VHPEEFVEMAAEAEEMGFAGVMAGPLVRSSYRAGLLWPGLLIAATRVALLRVLLVSALLLVSAHRLTRIRLAIVGRELGTHDGLSGR